ncbi:MAG: hypothetical protein H0T42_15425 [Deltaproteobacteria bacterium]|nr:hypothetical protein [Deltaproteobacteria bacterium]
MRHLLLCLSLTGCVDERVIDLSVTAVSVPQGAGVNVAIAADGYPVPNLETFDFEVEPPEIATAELAADGTHVRVSGVQQGDAIVRIRHRYTELELPTHVSPPAVVILWIEPGEVAAPVGSLVAIRATGLDTMGNLGDVSATTRWEISDPAIARLDRHNLRGMAAGDTTLHAMIDGAATSVTVSIAP